MDLFSEFLGAEKFIFPIIVILLNEYKTPRNKNQILINLLYTKNREYFLTLLLYVFNSYGLFLLGFVSLVLGYLTFLAPKKISITYNFN